jgi:hypothetical protein
MAKSAKPSASETSRSQQMERLTDALNRLADEVRVVRDVLDETREDLSWLTRNGVSRQPTVHTQLLRMALNPLAPDADERLEFRRFSAGDSSQPQIAAEQLEELVSEIAEIVTGTGQEQVNLLLGALDDMRAKLVAAIKSSADEPQLEVTTTTTASDSQTPAKQGKLF